MTREIQILLVEDSEQDALLIALALADSGLAVRHQRVETAAAFRAALSSVAWDIVLADYSLPGYSGIQALVEVRATKPDLPVVLISGAIGEEDRRRSNEAWRGGLSNEGQAWRPRSHG